jgi:hypothetical protein
LPLASGNIVFHSILFYSVAHYIGTVYDRVEGVYWGIRCVLSTVLGAMK